MAGARRDDRTRPGAYWMLRVRCHADPRRYRHHSVRQHDRRGVMGRCNRLGVTRLSVSTTLLCQRHFGPSPPWSSMNAIMALTDGRAPPGQNTPMLCAGSHWTSATRGSPAPSTSFARGRRSSSQVVVLTTLYLSHPLAQRFTGAADLRCNRSNFCPL